MTLRAPYDAQQGSQRFRPDVKTKWDVITFVFMRSSRWG
jgi:hypothetical protein